MNAAEIDWRVLRGSMIGLVIVVLISGGALLGSYQFANAKRLLQKRERANFMNARNQYHTLDKEEGLIATYLPRYIALETAGIIGREKRLDWIESLRQSAKQAQVAKLNYRIDAQKPFNTGTKLEVGNYRVFASRVSVDVDLLHEGDLLALLDNFNRSVAGLYGLSDCAIQHPGKEISMAADAINLRAKCHLNFLTIRKSDPGDQG